jgi:beta-lactamase superfamily II metal-dependent hydrolase
VDGGPDPDRLLVALDARVPPWDRRLDLVVLTHPHEDHVAGLALLLDRYGVRHVAEPGMRGAGAGYTAWAERVESGRHDAPFRLAAGDRVTLDGIDLDVRWPLPGRVPAEPSDSGTGINNVSIVFVGRYAGRGFLLAGDIEQAVDPELVAAGLPRVDVLKVAHHGSRTATTSAFLDTVRPAIAVASAGAGNPYGHPARETIERIEATGAALFRTDLDGTVEIAIGADGVRATAGRSRPITGAAALTASTGSRGLASVASGPTIGGTLASAFACGVPLSQAALTPVRPATAVASGRLAETDRPRGWSRPPDGHLDLDAGARVKPVAAADESGRALALLYHRADVGPRPRGRRGALPHDPKARRPRAPHDRLGLAGRRLEARRRASSSRAPPP